MRLLTGLFSFIFSSVAIAQNLAPGVTTPSTVKNSAFVYNPQQAQLEEEIHQKVEAIIKGALGPSLFANVSVSVKLVSRTSSTPEGDKLSQFLDSKNDASLLYNPDAWEANSASTGVNDLIINAVNVDITFDERIDKSIQDSLIDTVKKSLSVYPVTVNAQILPKATMEIAKKIESQNKSLEEKMKPWNFVLVGVFLILGLVILSVSFLGGLGRLANSMSQIAGQFSTTTREVGSASAVESAGTNITNLEINGGGSGGGAGGGPGAPSAGPGAGGGAEGDAGGGGGRPGLSPGMRVVERNQKQFKTFLHEKPMLLSSVLSTISDSDLFHLRVVGSYLEDAEKLKLRDLLGSRISLLTQNLDNKIPLSVSLDWLSGFMEKLHTTEITGTSKALQYLSEDELKWFLALSPADLKKLCVNPDVLGDKNILSFLTDTISSTLYEQVMAQLPADDWLKLVSLQEEIDFKTIVPQSLPKMKDILNQIHVAQEESGARSLGPTALQRVREKWIPSIIKIQTQGNLFTEYENWNLFYQSNSEDMRGLIRDKYWTLDMILKIPKEVLTPWIVGLDNNLLAYLLWTMQKLEMMDLRDYLVKDVVPEGIKKAIALDIVNKYEQKAPPDEKMKEWSKGFRRILDQLRLSFQEGRYNLVENAAEENPGQDNIQRLAA